MLNRIDPRVAVTFPLPESCGSESNDEVVGEYRMWLTITVDPKHLHGYSHRLVHYRESLEKRSS